MKTKNLKEQGITLVALVVTIIILLILAGVTINIALRENGLFKMARTGTNKYEQSAVNEQTELANVVESLKKEFEAIDGEEINKNPKKYYGEYVKYGIDLDGDSKFTSDWRLFYVGDSEDGIANGRIFLIAADYVPTCNPILSEAMVKANMVPATESIYGNLSAFWGNSTPDYQPLNSDENSNSDPIQLFMHTGYDLTKKSNNTNSRTASTLLNTTNWAGFAGETYGSAAIGGPTLEMWCKAWNKVVDTEDTINNYKQLYANGDSTNGYGYYVGPEPSTKNNYILVNGTGSSLTKPLKLPGDYPVFFTKTYNLNVTANGVTGNCNGYWLASPSAENYTRSMFVGFTGKIDNANTITTYFPAEAGNGLRPIVCLESGVKLQKNEAESTAEKIIYDIVK